MSVDDEKVVLALNLLRYIRKVMNLELGDQAFDYAFPGLETSGGDKRRFGYLLSVIPRTDGQFESVEYICEDFLECGATEAARDLLQNMWYYAN